MRFRYFRPDGDFFLHISSHLLTFNHDETTHDAMQRSWAPTWSWSIYRNSDEGRVKKTGSGAKISTRKKNRQPGKHGGYGGIWVQLPYQGLLHRLMGNLVKSEFFGTFQLLKSWELCYNVESCHGKKGCHAGNCINFWNECWNMGNSVIANGCLAIELPSPN